MLALKNHTLKSQLAALVVVNEIIMEIPELVKPKPDPVLYLNFIVRKINFFLQRHPLSNQSQKLNKYKNKRCFILILKRRGNQAPKMIS